MIQIQLKHGLLCAVGLLALVACTAIPQPELGIKWLESCPGKPGTDLTPSFLARIECGIVTVPLDHLNPTAGTLDLDITRVAAQHPEQREGAIFTNYGGAEAAGDWTAVNLAWAWTMDAESTRHESYQRLTTVYDVIGLTYRGAGNTQASQLICQSDEVIVAQNDITEDRSPANIKLLQHNAAVLARGCANQRLAPYINTEQAARDLEFVRIQLNESKLNYVGYAYGTWLGAWYAGLYPKQVGRMVLDSNMDWTTTLQNNSMTQAPEKERVFSRFFEQVAIAHPQAYQMGEEPQAVRKVFTQLLPEVRAALRSNLFEFNHVEYLMAAQALSQWLRETPAISDATLQGKALAYRFSPDNDVNERALKALGALLIAVRNPVPWNRIEPGPLKLTPAESVRLTAMCNDSVSPGEAFWVEKENQFAVEHPVGGSFFPTRHCAGWPGKALDGVPLRHLAQVDSIVMVQAEYGDQTPSAGGFAAFHSLPNTYMTLLKDAYLSEVAFSYNGKDCVNDKVADYLASGRKPERLSTCAASDTDH